MILVERFFLSKVFFKKKKAKLGKKQKTNVYFCVSNIVLPSQGICKHFLMQEAILAFDEPPWPLNVWLETTAAHTDLFLLSSTVALVRQQHSDLVFALAVWHWEQNIAQRNEPIGGCHLAFGMVLVHCLYGPQLGQSGLQAKDLDMLDGKCNFPFAGVMAFCKNDGIST